MRARRRFLLAFCLLVIVVIAGSSPRRVGNGGEYLAMALNLARFHRPSLSTEETAHIKRRFAEIGSGFGAASLSMPLLRGPDGRRDLVHFWLYPALAVPPLRWLQRRYCSRRSC